MTRQHASLPTEDWFEMLLLNSATKLSDRGLCSCLWMCMSPSSFPSLSICSLSLALSLCIAVWLLKPSGQTMRAERIAASFLPVECSALVSRFNSTSLHSNGGARGDWLKPTKGHSGAFSNCSLCQVIALMDKQTNSLSLWTSEHLQDVAWGLVAGCGSCCVVT